MAIPNTSNTSPLFLTRTPGWERGVRLKQSLATNQTVSRAGLEQRVGRQMRSSWSIQFSVMMDRTTAAARLVRAAAEMRAPVVVPFWPIPGRTVSLIAGDKVTINRSQNADFYTAGDYVYFWDAALGGQFRLVTGQGVSEQEITLASMVGALSFPIGSRVYPCRVFIRAGNAETTGHGHATTEEDLTFSTL